MKTIMLDVPDDWKEAIDAEAAGEGTSVNRWLQQIVARILKRRGYDLSEPKRVGRPKKVDPKTTEQQ